MYPLNGLVLKCNWNNVWELNDITTVIFVNGLLLVIEFILLLSMVD